MRAPPSGAAAPGRASESPAPWGEPPGGPVAARSGRRLDAVGYRPGTAGPGFGAPSTSNDRISPRIFAG